MSCLPGQIPAIPKARSTCASLPGRGWGGAFSAGASRTRRARGAYLCDSHAETPGRCGAAGAACGGGGRGPPGGSGRRQEGVPERLRALPAPRGRLSRAWGPRSGRAARRDRSSALARSSSLMRRRKEEETHALPPAAVPRASGIGRGRGAQRLAKPGAGAQARGLNPFRPAAAWRPGEAGSWHLPARVGGWAATRALRAPLAPGLWRSHTLDGRGAARAETTARLAPWRFAESAGGRGGPSGGPRGAWQPPAGTQPAPLPRADPGTGGRRMRRRQHPFQSRSRSEKVAQGRS
uniref:Uncharacterized protein n=1 Tax=Rangifer tarandus platyrhynchus TaxID=3082113 RepID=A0ACB0FD88_RANTA|nr:unnamed protein product [Rangifer tarandus platyrhynchus]